MTWLAHMGGGHSWEWALHCARRAPATATMGRLSASKNVQFVGPGSIAVECSPHIKVGDVNTASANLHGTDGAAFPGGTIKFTWDIPLNSHEVETVDTTTTEPIEDLSYSDIGPVATSDDWGTWQVQSGTVILPQGKIKATQPAHWTLQYLEGEGLTITGDWDHGVPFSFTIDPDKKYCVKVSKDF